MTIQQALETADTLRPNTLEATLKTGWLAQLDGTLRREIFAQSAENDDAAPGGELRGADRTQSPETVLLAGEPDSAIYPYWLCAQIDYALGETVRYANSMALYNAALAALAAAHRASARPRARGQLCY